MRRGDPLDHVLALTLPHSLLARSYAYPAAGWDRDDKAYAGITPMGGRLAIPPGALPKTKTAWGKKFAAAMQTYGAVVVDSNVGGITWAFESYAASGDPTDALLRAWNGDLQQDIEAVRNALELVGEAHV